MPRKQVVVIGGGLAGLAAATELVDAGNDVIVLEAGSRPGGRVRTLRDSFGDGLYAEAGGESFYPVEPDLARRFIERFDLTVVPRAPSSGLPLVHLRDHTIRPAAGAPLDWLLDLTPEERRLGLPGMQRTYLEPLVAKVVTEMAGGRWSETMERFDRQSFAQMLAERGASPDAVELLRVLGLDLIGEGADEYSGADVAGQVYNVASWGRRLSKPNYAIAGGNDRLPVAMAAALGERVHYGTAVVRVEHDRREVRLTYVRAGASHTTSATHVVCAVPFTALRNIDISPPFSPGKRWAIAHLSYSSVARIFVQTRSRFWSADGLSGFAFTDLPLGYVWPASRDQPGTRGILQCYVLGAHARTLATMADADRQRWAGEQLRLFFPALVGEIECGTSLSWDAEPWAWGGYAWLWPGEFAALAPHIASAEGRVYFAGEHTASLVLRGSMQGALESGIRAANAIDEAG